MASDPRATEIGLYHIYLSLFLFALVARPATICAMEWENFTTTSPMIVLDAHEDILLRLLDPTASRALDEEAWAGQVNLASWHAGGMNAVFFAVWIDPRLYPKAKAVQRAHQMIDCLEDQVRTYPQRLAFCDSAEDIRRVTNEGRIAALLGIEGGVAINNDISLIEVYRRRGVRYMTLTWRGNLTWAGSSQELGSPWGRRLRQTETTPVENLSSGGLTAFGREVVREMNRVGMVVDLSHVSDRTFFEAIGESTLPVMVSHSNARTLSNHPRNVSDDMLRALKDNHGVVGINFWTDLLEVEPVRGEESRTSVTIEAVLDHIDHIAKIASIDNIGIGTDYEGMTKLPVGLENVSRMPTLFEGLRKRGYSATDIRKIAGENFLRVLRASDGPPGDTGLH